ncbi:hypothetical protein NKI88_18510 [Mesorhizobium sp. M0317]
MARSSFYDRPERPADDTAIVEAIVSICDEFEFYGYRPWVRRCVSKAWS